MTTINSRKVCEDQEYSELYLKYLGTLKVLANIAGHAERLGPDEKEELEACRDDAAQCLKPHLVIKPCRYTYGFTMETAT